MPGKNSKNAAERRQRPPLDDDEVLSENQRRIIKQVIEAPGLTSYVGVERALAEAAPQDPMPYDTVRVTVDGLVERGYLEKSWAVNFRNIGYRIAYRIDVMIDPYSISVERHPESKVPLQNPQQVLAAEILRLVEQAPFKNWVLIEDIEILLGDPADLCITARVASHNHIFDFVTRGLRSLQGVRQTSTCQIPWSVRSDESKDKQAAQPRG